MILTSAGFREAVIYAETLMVFEKEDSTLAKGVRIDFYDEKGKYQSTLTAQNGLVRQKLQKFAVWGNVVVVNDSSRLETESLYWNPKSKLITTDDFVRLERNGDVVTGYGLEADNRLQSVRILRDVKGKVINLPQTEEELDQLEGEEAQEVAP